MSWADAEGLPYPLGLSWSEDGLTANFAIYSKHASAVHLLLYAADDPVRPHAELALDPMRHKSGRVWHVRVPAALARACRYYAVRADGPDPAGRYAVHAFHPEKILLDPYARAIFFPPGFDRAAAIGARANDGAAPLGVIELDAPGFDWRGDRRPAHESDAILYELHVGGFTQHPSSGVAAPGTFAGVVEKIPHLRELGVTIVELMPVFQRDPQGSGNWGYMPLGFFAPHHGYGSADDFRRMVRALHDADLEVVIDVVYHHTAEGGANQPVYSFKGLDNSTYYLMTGPSPTDYADYAGTGNSLNCTNRYVRKMILDSMRYWVREMRVDGFRFDLASVFTRKPDGSIDFDEPSIIGDIASDPDFDRVRMIAEPWDAAGAYSLGRAFPGVAWLQWNGRFRDDVRRFVRGDAGQLGALMQRLYGSDDLFPDDPAHAYHAYQSVNYVTCHDGPTLYDLVAYDRKHNEANGHGNLDGPPERWSWNCGFEGDVGAPAEVRALRERQARNLAAMVLLANGTPMLRAGDEFLQTQRGNDNPYNQDNDTFWLDWRRKGEHAGFFRFVRELIRFRKRHPSLGRSRFWREDVRWAGPRGPLALDGSTLAYALHGASQGDGDLYVMVNGGVTPVRFELQDLDARPWRRVVDTAAPSPGDILDAPVPLGVPVCEVAPRSIVVLER